jgi:hypothetical protein
MSLFEPNVRVSGVESRAYSLHHVVHSRISLKKPKLESELGNCRTTAESRVEPNRRPRNRRCLSLINVPESRMLDGFEILSSKAGNALWCISMDLVTASSSHSESSAGVLRYLMGYHVENAKNWTVVLQRDWTFKQPVGAQQNKKEHFSSATTHGFINHTGQCPSTAKWLLGLL